MFLLIVTQNLFADDNVSFELDPIIVTSLGYGPEHGILSILGIPAIGFGILINDTFYSYIYGNFVNSGGVFKSYGLAIGAKYSFFNTKATYFKSEIGQNNYDGFSFYVGPQLKVLDIHALNINFGLSNILNIKDKVHLNSVFPRLGSVFFNIELNLLLNFKNSKK